MKEITNKDDIATWAAERSWSLSGNNNNNNSSSSSSSEISIVESSNNNVQKVIFPTSTAEISSILASLPPETSVASVCGGHSSSNASTHPKEGAAAKNGTVVILDLSYLNSIEIHKETFQVTVGGGVLFRQLAEAVRDAGGALPIGTGDTVGVAGYVLNGGISGYFSRRLGLLGQRCTRLTAVLADGTIQKDLKKNSTDEHDKQLFHSLLGAGSALGIVTSMTFQMEQDTAVKYGGQLVVPCGTLDKSKVFARQALGFMKDTVLSDTSSSVSMELVVTADFTAISTFIFYDSFKNDDNTGDDGADAKTYVEPLRKAAQNLKLPIVVDDMTQWKKWFDMASCLWPIIATMKGDPILRLDHCLGTTTKNIPSDKTLDFVADEFLSGIPLDQAPMSIVEVRTLGGAMNTKNSTTTTSTAIPSGNAKLHFFVDIIVAWDAKGMSTDQNNKIRTKTNNVIALARKKQQDLEIQVDSSGTHCQTDDIDDGGSSLKGEEMFGSQEAFETVKLVKLRVDPNNRFRFHPFVTVL